MALTTDGGYNGRRLQRISFMTNGGYNYNGWLSCRMAVLTDGGLL
jgi:hypothetical protein